MIQITSFPREPLPRAGLVARYNDRGLIGLAVNDPAPTWLDISGRGNHRSHTEAAAQPTVSTLNGRRVLSFNGSQWLSGGAVITGTSARSIYIVCNPLSINTRPILDLNKGPTGTDVLFSISCELGVRCSGGRRVFTAPATGVWQIITIRMPQGAATSGIMARINGVDLAQTQLAAGTPNTGTGGFAIGFSLTAAPYLGSIAEVLLYDVDHTDTEAARVERSLTRYWNL